MKNIDLTSVAEIIVSILSLIITSFLIPYLKSKLSAQQQEKIRKYVSVAVRAAEQLYGGGAGQQKMEYVQNLLLSKGYVLDINEITALIESEVYKLTKSE